MSETGSSRGFNISPENVKAGEWLFRQECGFVAGAAEVARIPVADRPEIAFAGRSNVGKSSLINALTSRKTLARASHTPGRTQQINFFDLGTQLRLVDLPGYGYAKASKEKIENWNALIVHYLSTRETLLRVLVLVDSRHGIKDVDAQTMQVLDECGASYIVVLTKTDKMKRAALDAMCIEVEEDLKNFRNAHPSVICTSSDHKYGLEQLRALIAQLGDIKKPSR